MIGLQIIKIENDKYHLLDADGGKYILDIEFYDLDFLPSLSDYIYMDKCMLNDGNMFKFGSIMGSYGKNILDNNNKKEIVVIKRKNELVYLKRYYG